MITVKRCPQCHQVFAPLDAVCPKCNVVLEAREIASMEVDRTTVAVGAAPGSESTVNPRAPGFAAAPDRSQEPTTVVTPPPPGWPNGAAATPQPPGWPNGAAATPQPSGSPNGAAAPQSPGAVFVYTGRSSDGQKTAGELQAPNEAGARSALREQGVWVSSLRPKGGAARAESGPGSDRLYQSVYSGVPLKAKAFFFRQLSSLVRSGIPLAEALSLLKGQTSNKLLKEIAGEAARHCGAGGRMSEVFKRHPYVFPLVVLEMITAGEEAGRLERFLAQIADYMDREYQVVSRIKGAMTYPAVVMLGVIFIPSVPILVTAGVVPYAAATLKWLFLILLVIAIVVIPIRLMLTNASFAMSYDRVKLSLPLVGKVVRQFTLSKFGRTLALLYSAGVSLSHALEISANSCGNRYITARLNSAVPVVQAGGKLSDAIKKTGCFPETTMYILATGEHTGDVDMMVTKMAEFAEADANQAVDQTIHVLMPASIVLLAIVVCIKLIAFYTGYFSNILSGAGQ
ncbi:MAG TPA: type II secretion system F family protein [Armatimonadota bacterium]|nr:type II secretion system F family protein [Armatimonadota bacterium]